MFKENTRTLKLTVTLILNQDLYSFDRRGWVMCHQTTPMSPGEARTRGG